MASSLPRKQRKARYDAHTTARRKQMAAPVERELRKNMAGRKRPILYPRSMAVRKGDRVRVVRGQEFRPYSSTSERDRFRDKPRGKTYKVTGVDARRRKIYVENKTYRKKDMSEISYPIDPSNVVIVNPDWSDPFRRKLLIRINESVSIEEVEAAEDKYETETYDVEVEEEEDLEEGDEGEEEMTEAGESEEEESAGAEESAEEGISADDTNENEDLAEAKEAETDETDENEPTEAPPEPEVVEPETGEAGKED